MNENDQDLITFDDFSKIKMCVGTVVSAELNEKARKPAYRMDIDFGAHGVKTSSAQIVENYQCEDLIGKQVVAVMNFPVKRVAGVKSEVLVIAAVSDGNGTVLLQPSSAVENGCTIA